MGPLDGQKSAIRLASSNSEPEKSPFPHVKPCLEPVGAHHLLNDVVSIINRFISCEPHVANAAALWIASTWCKSVNYAPIAIINAPEKRCGKSQFLDLMECLVYRPVKADHITPAVLFRIVEEYRPTVLIDEFDTFLAKDTELIAVFNSGVKPNGQVWRCDGKDNKPRAFSTFSHKAIAGIGMPPDTILDRGIPLTLSRKRTDERRDYISDVNANYWNHIKSKLAKLSIELDNKLPDILPEIREKMPDELNDRQRDSWHALLAIAEIAGNYWAETARASAVKIHNFEVQVSDNVQLLSDVRLILLSYKEQNIFSSKLHQILVNDKSLVWIEKNLTQNQMSRRLSTFGIKTKPVRVGDENLKGYEVTSFTDIFARYLPPEISVTTVTSVTNEHSCGLQGDGQSVTNQNNPTHATKN